MGFVIKKHTTAKATRQNAERRITPRGRLRLGYSAAFLLLLAAEILIGLYVRDAFIRPYVGDILVVIVLYCAVRIVEPSRFRSLPLLIFGFAILVEAGQYIRLDRILGLDEIRLVRIILGATFEWKDIACYAIGCAAVGLWEWSSRGKANTNKV